jgi:cytochrome c oxidase subunit 2
VTRSTIIRLAAAIVVLTVISATLMLIPDWTGERAAAEAEPIDRLFKITIAISSFVFSLVVVLLGYAVWRFRAKPGDESDGKPVHGNTRLEIIWTLVPTLIVLFLGGYSWVVLDDIESEAAESMPVRVIAQQFAWTFEYPEQGVVSDELHVPVGTQLDLRLTALDVVHSFWVPEWRIKRDLVPTAEGNPSDVDDTVRVTPDREGHFQLVCAELCGLGHAVMRAPVVVESEQEFEQWVAEQEPLEQGEGDGEQGTGA